MRGPTQELCGRWERFWFESDGQRQLGAFRRAFALLIFSFYCIRVADLGVFFGEQGIVPRGISHDLVQSRFRYSVLDAFSSMTGVYVCHALLLAALLWLAWGKNWRWAARLTLILHVSFLHRNMAVVYGVDLIATFFLLYLSLPRSLGSVAYRLSQIQVCLIYGYSGFEKLRGPLWWRGEALWSILANSQLARWNFGWTSHFPVAIVAMTYLTVLWEVYFPALVWLPSCRRAWLLAGVGLHLAIALTMNLPAFGTLMILTYLLFIKDHELDAMHDFLFKKMQKYKRTRFLYKV